MACEHGYERGPSYCPFCRRAGAPAPQRQRKERTGIQRKEQGQKIAWDGATEEWKAAALEELRRLAASGTRFTSEDITAVVGLPSGEIAQHKNNAVGTLMGGARKRGEIIEVDWTRSTRPSSNGARLSVYVGAKRDQ